MATPECSRKIVLASRASELAQVQTVNVRDALAELHPDIRFETSFMATSGDKNQSQSLYLVGGKAFWTKELEAAMLEGSVDLLVHCFKDVPTVLPEGCEIAGVLEREDPLDCLIMKQGLPYKTLEDLPDGSVIGTSSVRRVAQLKRSFPKLVFKDCRGNLNTRLAKLDAPDSPFTAIVLAKAGMVRLGWGSRITCDLGPPTAFHAVAQGALAIEIRSNDEQARALCRSITHWQTEWSCLAERACLRVLEGGCSVPVGVYTALVEEPTEEGARKAKLQITGCVTSLEGDEHVEHSIEAHVHTAEEGEAIGVKLAQVLIETGARQILDDISTDREKRIQWAQENNERVGV
ncbi:porphobilinogen deaminase [Lentinus tigrinus ALCF2SS1-7]|uniref:Porphobilinogen deaminase n=1 Tax=Lentinus tigrinus ALCF2SS1-6 TaxID=1328759 RepID=A0A5C2S6H9_9APHY|nr:porphobilinogen deaminase [Lentinus tigrinus ALCF2SS1-6]RPD68765.1 porphobilinogen deaminase [Lentinus tigrinus ALCF2SS1-7]